jgi:hypothetical protein
MQPHYLYLERVYHRFDFAKEADARVRIGRGFWAIQPGDTPKARRQSWEFDDVGL